MTNASISGSKKHRGTLVLITADEAALVLGVKEAWLRAMLLKQPCDDDGVPFFIQAGRTKLFDADDLLRVRRHIQNIEAEPKEHGPRVDGHVYFIRRGDFIKIGWSSNWQYRIYHMQTSSPETIIVLGLMPGTGKQEKAIHREFADLRHQGEWFRAEPELLGFIEQRLAAGLMVRP